MPKRNVANPIKAVKSKNSPSVKKGSKKGKKINSPWGYFIMVVVLLFLFFAFPFTRNMAFNFADQCLVWAGYGDDFQFNSAEIKIPRSYRVHGIDVSHHNGKIDWTEVEKIELRNAEPLSFVFIKATEGKDHLDDRFLYNWRSAKETMLLRGAYHYYIPSSDPLKQAQWFIKNVGLDDGDLPPVIDIEVRGLGKVESYKSNLIVMCKALEAEYGVKPIIYTSHNFFENYFSTKEFKDYKFWIARYDFHEKVEKSNSWIFWQHSEKGRVNGIRGKVDYNVFKGTVRDLNKLCVN